MHNIYGTVTSHHSSQQVNGNLISPNPQSDGPRNLYKVAKAEDHSQQLNVNGSSVELLKAFFGPRYQQEITTTVFTVDAGRHG